MVTMVSGSINRGTIGKLIVAHEYLAPEPAPTRSNLRIEQTPLCFERLPHSRHSGA